MSAEMELPDAEDPAKELVTDEMTAEEAASDPAAPKRRRLTKAQWAEIDARFELGEDTGVLCKEFGISTSAFTNHLTRAAAKGIIIKKGSKAHLVKAKVTEKIVEKAAEAAAAAVGVPSTFDSKRPDRIEKGKETIYVQVAMHQRATIKIQQDVLSGARTAADALHDLKALSIMAANIRETREALNDLLDIKQEVNEKNLPILEIIDLPQSEIDEMQAKSSDDDADEDDIPEIDLTEEDLL